MYGEEPRIALPFYLQEYAPRIDAVLEDIRLQPGIIQRGRVEDILHRLLEVKERSKLSRDMFVVLRYIEELLILEWHR
jgi:hypothetical protein